MTQLDKILLHVLRIISALAAAQAVVVDLLTPLGVPAKIISAVLGVAGLVAGVILANVQDPNALPPVASGAVEPAQPAP